MARDFKIIIPTFHIASKKPGSAQSIQYPFFPPVTLIPNDNETLLAFMSERHYLLS
jgi:hypothetical protein